MSKVLVTGGAGFIGSHVVDLLISENYEVAVVDDLSAGQRSNINKLAKFYHISIQDPNLEDVFLLEKPDFVIHLAALISVKESVSNPVENADINVLGSLNLLELCRKHKIKKFVFSSSAAVYSPEAPVPTKESAAVKPISPYGISKLTLEYYLEYYRREHQIPYVILRYANVYGPRQRVDGEAGVITVFLNNIFKRQPATINSDGEQTRDFIFVGDVARANILSLKAGVAGVFNVGTGRENSILELFNLLRNMTGNVVAPVFNPEVSNSDARRSALDPALIRDTLGFSPAVDFSAGLRLTLDWFRENFYDKEKNTFAVVAAYNEEKSIRQVIQELKKQVRQIVVVDDCSSDATARIASGEGVIVLRHLVNRGQGAALQTGIDFALNNGAQIIITFDADGQHQAADIPALVKPIMAGEAEVVLGSRFMDNKALGLPWWRRRLLKGGVLFTWFISGIKLTDAHNGFRAFSRLAAGKIRITEDQFAHASEILDKIARSGLKYQEAPVTVRYTDYSRSKGQRSWNAVHIAGRMIYSKLFSK